MMEKIVLKTLQQNGFVIIPNYIDSTICKEISQSIDEFNRRENPKIQFDEGMGGDARIFNFEKHNKFALNFANDKKLLKLVGDYAKKKQITKTVLAGKVTYDKSKNSNSGGDWHRDGDVKIMKAMLYLSDVTKDNGPFCFVKNSNTFDFKRRNNKYSFLRRILFFLKGLPVKPPRYSNNEIINDPRMKKDIFRIEGKSGTVIIFDGNYIHRGDIIKSDKRYTLTNYYSPFEERNAINYIKNKFKKFVLN